MKNVLKELENKIKAGDFAAAGRSNEWGGAGVIFTTDADRPSHSDDKKVVTPYAGQIARLIDAMKPHLRCDYVSKYDCFGQMADAVAACPPNADLTAVLLAALHAVQAYLA